MTDFQGDSGNNIFTGDDDRDMAFGNGGNDTLSGNGGDDTLVGGAGRDVLKGGNGEDRLFSANYISSFSVPYFDGVNFIYMPPVIDSDSVRDTLIGGAESDTFYAGYGDTVNGGGNGNIGDNLYVSFLVAPSGISFDGDLISQEIGGGTISGIENMMFVQGSDFDDTINGRSRGITGGVLMGMGGKDTLIAGYNTSTVFGGDGDDIVDGRSGGYLDRIFGDDGNDTLYTSDMSRSAQAFGGSGNDTIYAHGGAYGGSGNDLIVMQSEYPSFWPVFGESGDDEIRASYVATEINGGEGADRLLGDIGNDRLNSFGYLPIPYLENLDDAGLEHDIVTGKGGDDTISIGIGDDADGGIGNDTLRLSLAGADVGVTFSNAGITGAAPFVYAGGTISNFENFTYLRGSAFNDGITIETQATRVTVFADAGNDVITSKSSSVTANGGSGNDRFISGRAGDEFDGGEGVDTVDYAPATVRVSVQLSETAGAPGVGTGGDSLISVENVSGSELADILKGNYADNFLLGRGGDDQLFGRGGNDVLSGVAGADRLLGGAGNDRYIVTDALDSIIEKVGEGFDTVEASLSFVLAAGQEVEALKLNGGAVSGIGNEFNNQIFGNALANGLDGGQGDDQVFGQDGLDTLLGGAGIDKLFGGAGRDTLDGGGDDDLLVGGADRDVLTGGSGADIFSFYDGDFGGATIGLADRITDFSRAEGDLINLRPVDAKVALAGNQTFQFIGNERFSGVAGQLRFQTLSTGDTYVYGDTDGDSASDFVVRIDGAVALLKTDFIL